MAAAAAHAAAAAASSGLNPAAAGSMGGLGSGSTPPKKLRLNSSVSASVVGAGSGLNPGASILNSASFSDSNKLLHHSNLNLQEKDSSTTNKINRSQSKSASNTLSMTAAGMTPRGAMGAGSSSLMPPPLQPPVIAGANPALAGASGTISTLKIHEINTATGEKQFVKTTSRKDTGNFRLNPITGELESGPSESSSEGEADTPTSGLEAGSMNSISSNSASSKNSSTGSSGSSNMNSNSGRGPDSSKAALKLKLKLPVTPPTSSSEVSGGHSRLSSMTSSSSDFSSKNDPKVSKSDLNNGPKLPKLILSMRDKTVKVSANSLNKNKRALEEADMDAADDSDGQDSISESQNITVPSLQGKLKIKSPKRTLDSDVKTEFNIKSEFNTKLVPSSSSSNSSSTRHGTLNNHVNSSTTNQSKSSSKNSSNNSSGSTNNSSSSDSKDSSSKQGVQVNNSTANSSSDSSKKSSNNSSGILKKADLAGNSNSAGSGSSTPSSSTNKKLHNNDRLSAWAKTLSSRLEKGAFANSIEHDHDAEDFASNIKKGKFSKNHILC